MLGMGSVDSIEMRKPKINSNSCRLYHERNFAWNSFAKRQVGSISKNEDHLEELILDNKRNKIFTSLVIHDLRNPTVAIKLALQEVIKALEEASEEFEAQDIFMAEF